MTGRRDPFGQTSDGPTNDLASPAAGGWPKVRPLPTQATRRWVRDRLMQARIGGLLTLTALQNLFTAEVSNDEER
jgi:hypothetical protein